MGSTMKSRTGMQKSGAMSETGSESQGALAASSMRPSVRRPRPRPPTPFPTEEVPPACAPDSDPKAISTVGIKLAGRFSTHAHGAERMVWPSKASAPSVSDQPSRETSSSEFARPARPNRPGRLSGPGSS